MLPDGDGLELVEKLQKKQNSIYRDYINLAGAVISNENLHN